MSSDGSDDRVGARPLHHDTDDNRDDSPIIVTTITKDDVLLGRGKSHHDHPGNVRFNELISTNQEKYAEMGSPIDKKQLICEIIDKIHERGRFLKRLEYNRWKVVGIEQVHLKVAHAIQYQRRRKTLESSTSNISHSSSSYIMEAVSPFDASQYGGVYASSPPMTYETMQTPAVPYHPSMDPYWASNVSMKHQRSMSFPFVSRTVRSDPSPLHGNIDRDSLSNASFFSQQQQPNSHIPAASYNAWNSRTSTSVSPPKQRASLSLLQRPVRRQQQQSSTTMITTPPPTTLTFASAAAHGVFPSAPMTVPLFPPPERIPLQRSSTLPTLNHPYESHYAAMPTTTSPPVHHHPMDWLSAHPEAAATVDALLTTPPGISQRGDIVDIGDPVQLHPNPLAASDSNNRFQEEPPPPPPGVGQLHSNNNNNNDAAHERSTTSIGSFDLDELDDDDDDLDEITW